MSALSPPGTTEGRCLAGGSRGHSPTLGHTSHTTSRTQAGHKPQHPRAALVAPCVPADAFSIRGWLWTSAGEDSQPFPLTTPGAARPALPEASPKPVAAGRGGRVIFGPSTPTR